MEKNQFTSISKSPTKSIKNAHIKSPTSTDLNPKFQSKQVTKKKPISVKKKKKSVTQLLQKTKAKLKQQAAQNSRFLANGGFHDMFDKPTWAEYGAGNTHPTVGGLVYGDYMKTHNVSAAIPPYYPPDEWGK